MAGYYYLISSLPALMADGEPVINLTEFMDQCGEWLSDGEMKELSSLGLVPVNAAEAARLSSASLAWNDWETCLRNAIARHRGAAGQDLEASLRYELDCYGEIESGVQEAWSQSDPLERERVLYRLRWRFLDDLEGGHNFDFALIVVYKLKLMLREKWVELNTAAGKNNFTATLEQIEQKQN